MILQRKVFLIYKESDWRVVLYFCFFICQLDQFISLSRPYIATKQLAYIQDVFQSGNWSSQGRYTGKCNVFFKDYFETGDNLLTHSCTAALEIAALLLDLSEGDEVIVPAYTFVTTASAFALRGARIVWADSTREHPNISAETVRPLITKKTKAVVMVHYGGNSRGVEQLFSLCEEYGVIFIEDAAQAYFSRAGGRFAGSYGSLSAFSFHDTKPVSCGEGGLLQINEQKWVDRAKIILEKGTDRLLYLDGKVPVYNWCDLGSSYAASEIQAAVLLAQLEESPQIFLLRRTLWDQYIHLLSSGLDHVLQLPLNQIPYANNTAVFYIEIVEASRRNDCISFLRSKGIGASFHYLNLSESSFGCRFKTRDCPNAQYWADHIIRLPLHTEMSATDVHYVAEMVRRYFE